MTSEDGEEEDVDSGWDLGAQPGPASARPTPVPSSAPDPEEAAPAAVSPAARVGAVTRPHALPLPAAAKSPERPAMRPPEKREGARTSPALRTSIGLRKPAGQTEPPAMAVPANASRGEDVDRDEAPPTVGRPMPPPRSRSNTPKVTNAVQKARALDEALATTPTPTPAPPKRAPGGGIRIPLTDRSTTPPAAPAPEPAKPPPTALRFGQPQVQGERAPAPAITEARPTLGLPRGRKETLKLNRATQDFAVQMLTRDADRAERTKQPSAPPLDLHLPLELSLDEPLESVHLVRRSDPGSVALDDPAFSLDGDMPDDDIHVSMGADEELAPDELAAVDELDDVLDGLIDSLPTAALEERAKKAAEQSQLPRTTPPPPSLGELDLSLELDDRADATSSTSPGPRSKQQPPSLNPATTRGFHEDDPALAPIRDRVTRGDFMGALMRAENILQTEPDNVGATYFATMCQEKIRDLYFTRLGSGEGIPHIQLAADAIVALALDHRSGFLISLIDGIASIDDVLDMSGMPVIEALRLLLELKNEGVIGID